jgi:hypothetical protein
VDAGAKIFVGLRNGGAGAAEATTANALRIMAALVGRVYINPANSENAGAIAAGSPAKTRRSEHIRFQTNGPWSRLTIECACTMDRNIHQSTSSGLASTLCRPAVSSKYLAIGARSSIDTADRSTWIIDP